MIFTKCHSPYFMLGCSNTVLSQWRHASYYILVIWCELTRKSFSNCYKTGCSAFVADWFTSRVVAICCWIYAKRRWSLAAYCIHFTSDLRGDQRTSATPAAPVTRDPLLDWRWPWSATGLAPLVNHQRLIVIAGRSFVAHHMCLMPPLNGDAGRSTPLGFPDLAYNLPH